MIDLKKLYHIPWTKYNNPTGWIEVTTMCQLKCPECYRKCNQGCYPEHKDLEEIKKDIDRFIKERHIQHLSIAGGEPLLYPKLKEVVSYAKSKGIGSYIITNSILLNKKKILELKKAGDSRFVIHIDKNQGWKDTNKRREDICKMFREIKDTKFGFIMPVCSENFDDVLDLINICKKNMDIIDCLILSIYQNTSYEDNKQVTRPNASKVINFICKEVNSRPCAYLGKTISKDKPSWLYICPVFKNNKIIKYLSPEEYVNFWEKIFFENKIGSSNHNTLEDGSTFLTIQLIIPPEKINGKYDLCDGCPDAMYYKGKLIPSCLLERIKKGEKVEL